MFNLQPHKVLGYAAIAFTAALCACGSSNAPDSQNASASRTQWVDPAKLQPGPIQRENLTREQVERITRVQEIFKEVDPTPLAEWIDDFKRDLDPDREIRIYEAMAMAYAGFCTGRIL